MKRKGIFLFFTAICCLIFAFTISACADKNNSDKLGDTNSSEILVAYFSCTKHTEGVAEKIADITGGTLYEITPAIPYTAEDLNYNADCRANREQNDMNARPEISGNVGNMSEYEVVYLGYPIWWGEAPKIIYTFLESYDFTGKTVVPFCTSGSSGIGNSADNLHGSASGATWLSGRRFPSSPSQSEVEEWLNGLIQG